MLLTVQPHPDEVRLDALVLPFAYIEKTSLIVHASLGPDLVIEFVLHLLLGIPFSIYNEQYRLQIQCQNLLTWLKFQ